MRESLKDFPEAIEAREINRAYREAKRLENMRVPVLFRVDARGDFKGSVTAVFPTLPGSPGCMTCYARVGQHSSCSLGWVMASTRPATPEEFAALKRELESAPFHYRLRVVKRISQAMRDARNAEENRSR